MFVAGKCVSNKLWHLNFTTVQWLDSIRYQTGNRLSCVLSWSVVSNKVNKTQIMQNSCWKPLHFEHPMTAQHEKMNLMLEQSLITKHRQVSRFKIENTNVFKSRNIVLNIVLNIVYMHNSYIVNSNIMSQSSFSNFIYCRFSICEAMQRLIDLHFPSNPEYLDRFFICR